MRMGGRLPPPLAFFISEWYNAQCNYVINTDLSTYADTPVYSDLISNYNQVIPYKKKVKLAKNVKFSVFSNRYELFNDKIALKMTKNIY